MNDSLWEMARSWGCGDGDRRQIEDCWENAKCVMPDDARVIGNDTARAELGEEAYLSACCRAAFHATAVRETKDGRRVMLRYDLRG